MFDGQLGLFGRSDLDFDGGFSTVRRRDLGRGAWIDFGPAFLRGHSALFETLLRNTRWRTEERQMYERVVAVPRLYAALPSDGPGHPILAELQSALNARYGVSFERITLALYRDGRDSVAWHGDYVARRLDDALVASVSLGAPRRFLLRPASGGASLRLTLGWGDLLVMGGTCQRTFHHAIPKVAHAEPRIVVMFRPHFSDDA